MAKDARCISMPMFLMTNLIMRNTFSNNNYERLWTSEKRVFLRKREQRWHVILMITAAPKWNLCFKVKLMQLIQCGNCITPKTGGLINSSQTSNHKQANDHSGFSEFTLCIKESAIPSDLTDVNKHEWGMNRCKCKWPRCRKGLCAV